MSAETLELGHCTLAAEELKNEIYTSVVYALLEELYHQKEKEGSTGCGTSVASHPSGYDLLVETLLTQDLQT